MSIDDRGNNGFGNGINPNQYRPTEVDPGLNNGGVGANPNQYRPTEVDPGLNNGGVGANPNQYRPTEVDPGLNNGGVGANPNQYRPTEVDPGLNNGGVGATPNQYRPTEVDPGLGNSSSGMGTVGNGMAYGGTGFGHTYGMQQEIIFTADEIISYVLSVCSFTSFKNIVYTVYSSSDTYTKGGESAVFRCKDNDGNIMVAKFFTDANIFSGEHQQARMRVLEFMNSPVGRKHTLYVKDNGMIPYRNSNIYFEIMDYCPQGDMWKLGLLSFNQLVEFIRQINESLHAIHVAGFVHRDIKPENIFLLNGRYILGDFGSVKDVKYNPNTTAAKITEGYADPEIQFFLGTKKQKTFTYKPSVDYYSFGVTIASVFEGHYVFANIENSEVYTNAVVNGDIPLTRDMQERRLVKNLVDGLCAFSSKNRFGYEEVKKWLADHEFKMERQDEKKYEKTGKWNVPMPILHDHCVDPRELFESITKNQEHWEYGKKQLYKLNLESFFRGVNDQDMLNVVQDVVDKYRNGNNDKGLAEFLVQLYPQGKIAWKGYTFSSLRELAERMQKTENPENYGEFLQLRLLSSWLEGQISTLGNDQNKIDSYKRTLEIINKIENLSQTDVKSAVFWYANSFAKERYINIYGQEARDIQGVVDALFSSTRGFLNLGIEKLKDRNIGFDLYGFLYSYGYFDMIEHFWNSVDTSDEFALISGILIILDNIALNEGADDRLIREFFLCYSPVAIPLYVHSLVVGEGNVYVAQSDYGKNILDRMMSIRIDRGASLKDIYDIGIMLMSQINTMRASMEDNAFRITSGTFNASDIMCINTVGMFVYSIYGVDAPYGFYSVLQSVN